MKRWIAGLLTVSLLLTGVGFAASAEEEQTEQAAEQIPDLDFLNALGILVPEEDEEIEANEEMTRAEFASEALRLLNLDEAAYENGSNPYTDVDKYTDGLGAIIYLTENNMLYGYGDGSFRPDDVITTFEAADVAVRILGYGAIGNERLFTSAKSQIGFAADRPLTVADAAELFVRALEYKCVENNLSAEQEYVIERTMLEVQFDLEQRTGKVTANRYTSLEDTDGVAADKIRIDNTEYTVVTGKDLSGLLGYNVKFYCREDSYGDMEIVYAQVKNTTVTVVDGADIVGYSGGKLTYEENNRTKTISIPAAADIIYNGRALPDYSAEQIAPKQGSVTFLKNGGDIETVIIEDITDEIVYSVTSDTLYFKSGEKIKPEDYEEGFLFITDETGEALKLSGLAAKMTASVIKSADGELVRITVCNDTLSGALTSVDEDGIEIDGVLYECSPYYAGLAPEVGISYTFYLNIFGRVVNAERTENVLRFAYFIKVGYNEEADKTMLGLLMDDDTTGYYSIADKFVINGVSGNEEKLRDALYKNGEPERQLIQVKLNDDGEIKQIVTVKNRDSYTGKISDDDKITGLRLSYQGSSLRYKSAIKSFNGLAPVSASTVVFFVKTDAKIMDSDNFYTGSSGNLVNDRFYNFEAYNTQPGTQVSEAVVIYDEPEEGIGETTEISIVMKRSNTIDSDDVPGVQIMVMKSGKELGYMLDESIDPDNIEGVLGSSVDPNTYKLSAGDAIRFAVNSKGKISDIQMVYDVDSSGETKGFAYNLERYTTGSLSDLKYRILCGDVYDVDNGILRVAKKNLRDGEQVAELLQTNIENFQSYSSCKTYLVSNRSGSWQVSVSSAAEIVPYTHDHIGFSKLIMVTQYATPIMMIIYDEER